jgi:hypothetical protein
MSLDWDMELDKNYPYENSFPFKLLQMELVLPVRNTNYFTVTVNKSVFISKFGYNIDKFIWDKQRIIKRSKVEQIKYSILQKPKYLRSSNLIITIGTVNYRDPRIIDGQHRLKAIYEIKDDIYFNIQWINFPTEKDRFREFVEINSSTQIAKIYIDDYDGVSYEQALITADIIKKKYEGLFIHNIIDYTDLRNEIYQKITEIKNNINYDNIIPFLEKISEPYKNYDECPIPELNLKYCLAQKSHRKSHQQCNHKPYDGIYCGIHKHCDKPESKIKKFNPENRKKYLYKILDNYGYGYFIFDRNWVSKIIKENEG